MNTLLVFCTLLFFFPSIYLWILLTKSYGYILIFLKRQNLVGELDFRITPFPFLISCFVRILVSSNRRGDEIMLITMKFLVKEIFVQYKLMLDSVKKREKKN